MIKKIYYKNKNLILHLAVACTALIVVTFLFNSTFKNTENTSIVEGTPIAETSGTVQNNVLALGTDSSNEIELEDLLAASMTGTVNIAEHESEIQESEYTVTAYDTPVTMYTNDRVNVRDGAGTEYNKLTTLSWSTPLSVTGVTNNGWYQIAYDNSTAYVSADYVQESVPSVPYVFVGDSRTVQMEAAVGTGSNVWISKVGQGYSWFKNQIDLIDDYAGNGTKVIINMGVNDLANASKYISLINSYMDSWTEQGITVYYAAVTPVYDGISVSNSQIETFNATMQAGLDSRITWIDGYSYLLSTGFSSSDGLHYNYDTYRSLYSFYMSTIASLQ